MTHTWVQTYTTLGLRPIRLCAPRPDGTCSCTPQYHPGCTARPKTSTGKRPIGKDWQTRTFTTADFRQGDNVGLAMGLQPSGKRIVAVDVDGSIADLATISTDWPETLTARTGSGGWHLIYEWPAALPLPPNAVRLPGTSVDLRSEGGQIVVEPSVHYSGNHYSWVVQVPIAPLSEDTARALLTRAPAQVTRTAHLDMSKYTKDLAEAFTRAFPEHGYRHKACLALAGMIVKKGWPEERAVALVESLLAQTGWTYSEVEAENDVKSTLERLVNGEPVQGLRALSDMLTMLGKEGAEVLEAFIARIDLKDGTLSVNDKGKVLPSRANVEKVLALHPACAGALAFDEFRQDIVQASPIPTTIEGRCATSSRWQDEHANRLGNWLSARYGFELQPSMIHAQCETIARKHSFHPIRNYLRGLVWDGVPRISALFTRYFGAEDTQYTQAVSRMFMIGAVARVMDPGCKLDTAPVLIGDQGAGKSRTIGALLPDRTWFSDTKTDVGTKDAMINLQGTWIYEFAELANMAAADVETVKNFMSSASDKFRPPYARRADIFPRQIVFIGSTNREILFTDQSGNRRFWPITTHKACCPERIQVDRDQLWAEAMVAYQSGQPWYASVEVENLCREQQAEHTEQDPWEETITVYLDGLCAATLQVGAGGVLPDKTDPWEGLTCSQVLERAIGLATAQRGNASAQRVGRVMRDLGWTQRVSGRDRARRYFPPKTKPSTWTR